MCEGEGCISSRGRMMMMRVGREAWSSLAGGGGNAQEK
jgi:hypothetical protein